MPLTVLCIASYEKGHEFIRECKRQGCRVFLLTSLSLRETAQWPIESLEDVFYMPDQDKTWNRNDTILAISHLARTRKIDRIVPLDDFDLEMAASIREHLRIPGMGETTTRFFRDKLAMRVKAVEAGLIIPEFVHLLNDEAVRAFTERVPPPWVLKPRMLAGSIGIKKVESVDELQRLDGALGDQRSFYLVEAFAPGDVCHVDSIVYNGRVVFAVASKYGYPHGRIPARRNFYQPPAGARLGGIRGLDRQERASAGGNGAGAGSLPHRVHRRQRRKAVLPRNFGSRGGSAHSRFDRSRNGH